LIDRGEILAVAIDLGLADEIVEKDYVLDSAERTNVRGIQLIAADACR